MKRFNTSDSANKAFRKHNIIPVFLLALLTSMFSITASAAELLINGDFEQPDLSTFAKGSTAGDWGWTTFFGQNFTGTCTLECNGGTLIPGWSAVWTDTLGTTNTAGRVEIQSNFLTQLDPGIKPAKGGNQKVELDSHHRIDSLNNNVTIFQEFQVCANTRYVLSYTTAGLPGDP